MISRDINHLEQTRRSTRMLDAVYILALALTPVSSTLVWSKCLYNRAIYDSSSHLDTTWVSDSDSLSQAYGDGTFEELFRLCGTALLPRIRKVWLTQLMMPLRISAVLRLLRRCEVATV